MSTEDPDLQQLREFRAGLAEPSADRLARVRAKVVNAAEPAVRGRWTVRGLAVPAIAGAAVLAIAIGAAVVAFDGSDGAGSDPGGPPNAIPGEAVPADPEQGDKTSSIAEPPSPAEHQAAVNLLEQFAAAAGSGPAPLTVPTGQYLYVRGAGLSNNPGVDAGAGTYLHEMWVDPNGAIPVMIRRTDDGQLTVLAPDPSNPKDNHEGEVAERRAELAEKGPSLNQPTPAYLAELPTDPAGLLEVLKSAAVPSGGPWSTDHAILDFMRDLLYHNEPLLTPQVRAALYRALSTLDSISSTGQTVDLDGRTVYAIAQTERGQRQELLIDAQTGRFAGSRTLEGSTPTFHDLWTYAVVPTPGATP